MAESYTQLAGNSVSGNKMRENERTIGVDDVREQSVYQTARHTHVLIADNIAFAANKQHISLFNGSGSGVILRVSKLFVTNLVMNTTVSGGARRLEVKRITNASDGTDLTPLTQDTENSNIPEQVLFKTGATVSESSLLFPLVFPDDEMLLTQNSMTQQFYSGVNWVPEGYEIQEITCHEGEGVTVKQITSSTAGVACWIVVFTLEDA